MIKKLLLLSIILVNFANWTNAQYCFPTFSIGCTSNDFIDNFSTTLGVTNISNLGSGCNGVLPNSYVYNNTMMVSQVQGSSFDFTVQAGTAFSQGFAIWVDWNQDYDFEDAGENVYISPSTAITPFNGTITIPTTAAPGVTRMRVLCRFVTIPSATDHCGGIFTFGECEDYNLEVIPSVATCSGTPIAGTITPGGPLTQCSGYTMNLGLAGSSVTGGLSFQWEQSTNGGATWVNVIGGTGGPTPGYLTPVLTFSVWYRCVITCLSSGLSSTTAPLVINVTGPTPAPLPYNQSFESWTNFCDTKDVPDDYHWSNTPLNGDGSWRREDEGFTANWNNPFDGFYVPASSHGVTSARFHSYNTNLVGDLDMHLDCATLLGNKTMTFDFINNNFGTSGFDSLEVLLSDNGGVTFNSLGTYTNSPSWTNHALILNSNSSPTVVRFRAYGDFIYDSDMGIDNVKVLAPCTGTPNAGIVNPYSPCANVPFTLSLSGATISGGITYQWESAPTAVGPWTVIGTTAAPSFTTVVSTNTYFRCTVICQATGLSATTPVMYAQLASFYTCYCYSASAVNVDQQNIGNIIMFDAQNSTILNNGVATPLLNNPSVLNNYTDFSALAPATIYRDSTFDMKVTAFSKTATFANGYSKIYIDYNRDGSYDPVTENVGGGVLNAGSQTMTSTFTVPGFAQFGNTGMRIVYRVGGTATTTTPCGVYPSGETEDYLINISLPPCKTPPNAGIASISDTVTCPGYVLYLNDVGHDVVFMNLTHNWQYSSDGIIFNDIPGAIYDTLSYSVNNESWFRFRTTCNGTSNGYSNVLHVTMSLPSSCYGQSGATGTADSSDVGAFIIYDSTTNVNIYSYITGGPHLLNPSAVKNRTDRTGLGAMSLFTDSAYKFAVYHIMKSANHQDARVTVFIDYNNNLIYDIPQERVLTGTATSSSFYLFGYVRTPMAPAVNTPTGLRIVLNNNSAPNAASDTGVGLYESGETEDYLVSFKYKQLNPAGVDNMYSIDNIGVYPNPTSGIVYLGLTAKEPTDLNIQIISVTGALLSEKKLDNVNGNFVTELNLTNYAKGTYLIKIVSDKGNFVRRIIVD